MEKKSNPTLSPLRQGLAEATKRPQALANPFGIPLLRRPLASRTLAALVFFAVFNLLWNAVGTGKLKADDFSYDTWTSCAIADYLHGQNKPGIAFLGSSLVLYPAGSVDADLLNREIDGPRHHQSLFFEKKFAEQTGEKVNTFNFALPGEMPSDAYLITKFLFQGKKRPDVIVYGVGPRDFMDNLLPSPSATDPFRHLSRFGDYSTEIDKISPEWQERLNWELGRLIFPYGHKEDLSHSFDRSTTNLVNAVLPRAPGFPIIWRRYILPEYKACEVGKNDCMFRPYVDRPRPLFVDNLVEYRKRYKTLKWNTFLTQMEFLAKTMDIARARGIRFVLVSMPITELNRQLLSKTATDAYQKSLAALARAKGASLIDLDASRSYQLSDFEDTVHLHSGGGRKMLNTLAQTLAHDPSIREALGGGENPQSVSAASDSAASCLLSPKVESQPPPGSKRLHLLPQLATRKESFL